MAQRRLRSETNHDRPGNSKRPRRITGPTRSVMSHLLDRQTSAKGIRQFNKYLSYSKFTNMKLTATLDPYHGDTSDLKLCYLNKRSRIVEIVAAEGITLALNQTGVCTAFAQESQKRICFLNTKPDEVIRSLFYNKANRSLITVSVYRADNFSSLKCRSTRIQDIRSASPERGRRLFESESLRWPGFVEFDDVNGKVLTYSANDKIYKIWDLSTYELLYSIKDSLIQEIKISPGIMLLIFMRSMEGGDVPLQILDITNGKLLRAFKHPLRQDKKIDFIEQFNEKLLVKQEDEPLQIVNVKTDEFCLVPNTQFMTPSAFIFLYENQLFLTFRNHQVMVWDFRGKLVTQFEDHELWHPDCNTNNIYITTHQDCIISYCKDKAVKARGSLNISHILTGRLIAKISSNVSKGSNEALLEDVTSLFYDEAQHEIYTGSKSGMIHVWSH